MDTAVTKRRKAAQRRRGSPPAPADLKDILSAGLMSFPLTDFDADGDFNERGYCERLEWLMPYGAAALFAAGGTGEGFSLTPNVCFAPKAVIGEWPLLRQLLTFVRPRSR